MEYTIHPTTIIEDGVHIGKNVKIGPFCYIKNGVTIGDETIIESHVSIEGNTTIGKKNHLFAHSSIGSIPQDLKYAGEKVALIIGDENRIREFAQINPGTQGGGGITRIGSRNLLMGYVHIGHDVQIGDDCILANGATLAGHVELENRVVIGGLSAIHQFCKLGEYSMLAGASALAQDLPPYCMAEGNRATLRGLNLTGLRRLIDREEIDHLKSAYRELFEKAGSMEEKSQALYTHSTSQYVKKFADFIGNSTRGIPFSRKKNV